MTLSLLETMGVPYAVLDENWEQQVQQAIATILATNGIYALIVRKGTFDEYALQTQSISSLPLSREEAIKIVVDTANLNGVCACHQWQESQKEYCK